MRPEIRSEDPRLACPLCGGINNVEEYVSGRPTRSIHCDHCSRELSLTVETTVSYTLAGEVTRAS